MTRNPTARPAGSLMPSLQAYLDEFNAIAHQLPLDPCHQLRARIWIVSADAAGPAGDSAADERVRVALDELGPPGELVAAELRRSGQRPNPFRPADTAPIHLLAASILTLGIGAIVGVVQVWRSKVWPRRAKVLVPALVVAGIVALLPVPVLPPLAAVMLGGLVLGPVMASIYLLFVSFAIREVGPFRRRGNPARYPRGRDRAARR